MTKQNSCLYLFLDEGGNFDFSPKGTRFFTMSCVAMCRPFHISKQWDSYKYDCLEYGLDLEYFHCAEDNTRVRQRLFDVIKNNLADLQIDSLIVDKPKTDLALREDSQFYPDMLGYLLSHVFNQINGYNKVVVITDQIPNKKKRKAIEKGIKHILKEKLPHNMKYTLLHHASKSHCGLQIADYCNWAVYRKWANEDTQYYDLIKVAIKSEFDIFRNGARSY